MHFEDPPRSLQAFSKGDARRYMRKHLATLTKEYRAAAAEDLLNILKPLIKSARSVFLFAGAGHEINTEGIDEFLRAHQIRRAFPCVAQGQMRALVIPKETHFSSLKPGAFGIPSPHPDWAECDPSTVDIVLVPGLAFSAQGNRLGQGGGYYDRALPKYLNARRIAIGFDEQWVSALPSEAHDEVIHTFVSNRRVVVLEESA